ncbi:cytochrome C assembly protein [Eggerthellaceae bacterium zg-887]|uniref:heme lyase CcmF/NrfE family subunit n=1 Tax=Xiamenia xianingshaonis TaxID=2682776 RepID=UPI00140B34E9|nr:cytochrome c biogenesis protein CcsA [Xiamenia xianingshaonis]NHM16309.1 cytochrome C assembly protein [Xiamenia xianingshaonis]
MSLIGLMGLLVAFAGVVVSVVCLAAGAMLARKKSAVAETLSWGGHVAAILTAVALTLCCGILVYCFFAGDYTIEYVLRQHSDSSSELAWLYKLSGLWAGREGSLLFWAWLISLFNAVVAVRNMRQLHRLDSMALLVSQVVLGAFVGVLLFSESNMPFTATPAKYFNLDGSLTMAASTLGMNALLEHWAMAIHPPTLFVGYAGLTIPFAFAIGALVVNDPSREWVIRSQRYALFSWLFLGIGIGLGAVWAYVVLGWGGYWGWDPVENASLLSWLVGVALIHSFTVYRQRGAFKRWSVMCACLTFAFVIVGTFISRSGLVQSVHAFEGDLVSLVLFGALIVVSVLAGIVGLAVRWKSFGPSEGGEDDMESMASREAAYYFNNVIMVVVAFLLAYLTIASALPSWLPFGGQQVSTGTYDAIGRPLGVIYLAILAVCPLLSWGKTQGSAFLKRAKVPGICAAVLFAGLMVYFVTYLVPVYNDNVAYYTALAAEGDANAAEMLTTYAPSWYYLGLTVVGLAVASVLFFNALFMIARGVAAYAKAKDVGRVKAFFGMMVNRASTFGGCLAHFGMAVILVGLIGSSMYVTERVGYVGYDQKTDTATNDFTIQDFTLKYQANEVVADENGSDIFYRVFFDVYKGDQFVGTVDPTVQLVQTTQQQKLLASVVSFAEEDLFVVYRGMTADDEFSMDVRVNPLIAEVWVGFFLLMAGATVSTLGRRGASRKRAVAEAGENPPVGEGGEASREGKAAETPEAPEASEASEVPEASGAVTVPDTKTEPLAEPPTMPPAAEPPTEPQAAPQAPSDSESRA